MTDSLLLKIPQLAPNQINKETTINDGFSIMERSLNDIKSVDLSAGNIELNDVDYTRAFLFNLTGHTVARALTVPASKRLFAAYNNGTSDVTVSAKDAVGGLTAVVHPGSMVVIFNDTTNIRLISDSAASGQVSDFLSMTDAPSSYAGQGGKAVVVKISEDGLEFGTISVSFTTLTDTPSSYTGQALKTIRVNSAGNALEFATHVTAFGQLSDVPASYESQAGKMLVVNTAENAIEFVAVPDPVLIQLKEYVLDNNGFEDNNLTNWTAVGGTWTVGTVFSTLGAPEGSYFAYFDFGQGNGTISLAYAVDLTAVATDAELDAGNYLIVEAAMGSPNKDFGQFIVEFYDAADALISTATSPSYMSSGTFVDRKYQPVVPALARKAIITLSGESNPDTDVDPTSTVMAFDNLRVSLRIEFDPISVFTGLLDVPSSYTGFAGKTLAVKSTEDGLEFAELPTLRDYFTQLLDTPDTYTGQSGKALIVKTTEDGLEFGVVSGSFTGLTDTPNSFTGQTGKFLKVNTAEDALEFTDAPTGGGSQYVELTGFAGGTFENSEVIYSYRPTRNVDFPAGLIGSSMFSIAAATASAVFSIKKNGTEVGTATFAASGTTATLAMASLTSFTAGTDVLTIVAPTAADTTLADVTFSLIGDLV